MENAKLLVIWPTTRCNLRCIYCYASAECEGQDMDWDTVQRLLSRFEGEKLKVQFAGGEPLLCQELLWKTAEYLKKRQPETVLQLQTNGTLLNKDIVRKLKEYRFRIGISMDGLPEINERYRGATKAVLQGISCLQEAGIEVGLNAVLTGEHPQAPAELAKLALIYPNMKGIALDILRQSGRAGKGNGPVPPTPKQAVQALQSLYLKTREIKELTGQSIVVREIEEARRYLQSKKRKPAHCYASLGCSYVAVPDGCLYPCGALVGESRYLLGRAEHEAWKSISLTAPRNEECSSCPWEPWCTKGCPARYLANGREGQKVECAMKKAAFQIARKEIEEKAKYEASTRVSVYSHCGTGADEKGAHSEPG